MVYFLTLLFLVGFVYGKEYTWSQQDDEPTLSELLLSLEDYDSVYIPNGMYTISGGLELNDVNHVTLQLDGTLAFSSHGWPRYDGGHVKNAFTISNVTYLSIRGHGQLDGQGYHWWGVPFLGYLLHAENRPRLLQVKHSKHIQVSGISLVNSPYWTLDIHRCDYVEVSQLSVVNVRSSSAIPTLWDMTAFNTDGIDVSGTYIWVHDVAIKTQDDTIAVKGPSEHILIERVRGTGMGLAIGSIADEQFNNITIRDSYLEYPYKGIYIKFQPNESKFDQTSNPNPNGTLSNVLYENITLFRPLGWAVWVGPAQQSDTRRLCHANPCSICWPVLPGAQCHGQVDRYAYNITLRSVRIVQPRGNLGVIMGAIPSTFNSLVFDSVRVYNEPMPIPSYFKTFVYVSTPDPYLLGTLISIAVLLAFVCVCVFLCRQLGYIVSGVLFLFACFLSLSLLTRSSMVYTRCEGVDNGLAIGNTWPVPDCFENSTDSGNGFYHYTPTSTIFFIVSLVVVSIVIVSITKVRCCRHSSHFYGRLHSESSVGFKDL